MGLFDVFNKKKQDARPGQEDLSGVKRQEFQAPRAEQANETDTREEAAYAIMGVTDLFGLEDSQDLIVVGRLQGALKVGDKLTLQSFGDDARKIEEVDLVGIEVGPNQSAERAENQYAALRIKDGRAKTLRKSSVLFKGTLEEDAVEKAYMQALGEAYVGRQDGVLTPLDQHLVSIAELTEIWRLLSWKYEQKKDQESPEEHEENLKKFQALAVVLRQKIMQAPSLYAVYSTRTGEPYLFSKTLKRQDGTFISSEPMIAIVPLAYEHTLANRFESSGEFIIKKIENGPDKKGIERFLGEAFYLDGASGVHVVSEQTALAAGLFVAPPQVTPEMTDAQKPIHNPLLYRWVLLLGQMNQPYNEDQLALRAIYQGFLKSELSKATILVPIQSNMPLNESGQGGVINVQKGMHLKMPATPGKGSKEVLPVFTDWKRFRQAYDSQWQGLVEKPSNLLEAFDLHINPSQYGPASWQVTQEDLIDQA